MNTAAFSNVRGVSWWQDTVAPKEHGSWSLAFEPLVLGLLVAPSLSGGLLATALAAVFFARRPLRLMVREQRAERRRLAQKALIACGLVALTALVTILAHSGGAWMIWVTPMAVCGGVFAYFDAQGAGREELAEIAGAATFAFAPAVIASLAGWSYAAGMSLALVMLGRSVPTVMFVRSYLRAAKTGARHVVPALVAASSAILVTSVLVGEKQAPMVALVFVGLLAIRAGALLGEALGCVRARTLGMSEAIAGVVFVIGLALAW
jgi:hypothetical protein